MKALLLGEITPLLSDLLTKNNIEQLKEPENGIEVVIVRGGVPVDQKLIESLPDLKIVISAGIGVDNIDLEFCKLKSISVCNCPTGSTVSVAEHTIALLLAGIKNIHKASVALEAGNWDRKNNIGHDLSGLKVGLVGWGRIGSKTAEILKLLGFEVFAYDPYISAEKFIGFGVQKVDELQAMIEQVNYISLHLPKTPETEKLFSKIDLSKLQQPNGIVNTARGKILDEQIIIKLLDSEQLGFYATDVFNDEPKPNARLLSNVRTIATPHIAANTIQAQERIAYEVEKQIQAYIKGDLSKLNIIK